MKTRLLTIACLISYMASSQFHNDLHIENAKNMHLSEKVKSISQTQEGGRYNGRKKEYAFNIFGGLIEMKSYNAKGELLNYGSCTYVYNDLNQPVAKFAKNLENKFIYNKEGCLTEVITQQKRYILSKDSKCRTTQIQTLDLEGKLVESKTFKFAADSLVTEELRVKADGKTTRAEFAYDEKGRPIEELDMGFKTVYAYDLYGNKTLWQLYNPSGELSIDKTYSYTYDEFGNWISMKQFKDGELGSTLIRTIEYYQ